MHLFPRNRWPELLTLLFLASTALFCVAARAGVDQGRGEIAGRVVHGTSGEAAAGVRVSLLGQWKQTDSSGRFRFENVKLERSSLLHARVVDDNENIIGCSDLSVPVRFYAISASIGEKLAVEVVSPADGTDVELRLTEVSEADVNEFCARCHKPNPCNNPTRWGEASGQTATLGGVELKARDVAVRKARLRERDLTREAYERVRFQDAHPQSIDMRAKQVPDRAINNSHFRTPTGLRLLDNRWVTCDTCHSRHQSTGWPSFAVMEFSSENVLCRQCHQ
jgi:predicted CXXCH cytochrome family protein